jgi:hypothetical protein
MRQCERCGTGFEPTNYDRGGYQRFCSDRCNRASKAAKAYKRKHEERIAALKCRQCNEPIAGRVKQFCNQKCSSAWHNSNMQIVLVTRSCQCCHGIFVIDKKYRDRYCSQFCRGFMQEVWPRPVKRQAYDPRNDGKLCSSVECDKPVIAKELCIRHYSVMRMATGQRLRYAFTCEVCHLDGDSYNNGTTRHAPCQRRTSRKELIMSQSKELAIWENPKYKERFVNILPKGQSMYAGACWNCKAQWVSYQLRHTCSDECSAMLKKAQKARNGGGHRIRARHYGGEWHRGITPLSIFQASGWTCQLCLGPVDPREKTGLWMPTMDHIVPMARGGGHTRENLQLAHMICNSYKRDL